MSLFGSSPDDPSPAANASSQQKSSLFADEAPKAKASGGLFNDESANGESPWDMPSSKRASKGDPAKTLLPSPDVPESYIDAYDLLNASEGGNVNLTAARKLVGGSSIAPQDAEQILNLVSGGHKNPNLGRNEFNLLLALVGLAEEGDELSLDTVDERRKSLVEGQKLMGTLPGLPEPSLPYINQLRTAKATEHAESAPAQPSHSISSNSPGKSRRLRKDSLENLDADPWASPAGAKSQTNPVQNDATPGADAITAMKPARSAMAEPARTTSTFTTTTESPTLNNSLSESNGGLGSGPEAGAGWGNYGTSGIAQGGLGGGSKQSAEHYIGLCNLLERLIKRNQGMAADYLRFSQALTNLTEVSQDTYATDTNDVPLLNEGIGSTAKHLSVSQNLLDDEARAWDEGVLEDFKKQRDILVGVRDMFDRRDRYARDNIPQLERRIETNENRLRGMMTGPGGKPGEQEKLEMAVKAV
ncbi:MAG: Sorting nexin mvp1 [Ramalina farinacea]|uniref:Sorting nexin mvp1 n=1 Tax=Ramalina farinacea TaxID=258253 RepID=A0AA43QMP3_9LECA|nr:Sorting nexin mvp1 [Ramalina farinacea]